MRNKISLYLLAFALLCMGIAYFLRTSAPEPDEEENDEEGIIDIPADNDIESKLPKSVLLDLNLDKKPRPEPVNLQPDEQQS